MGTGQGDFEMGQDEGVTATLRIAARTAERVLA